MHGIKSGINLIDTAPWYGHGVSETILGNGLKAIPRKVRTALSGSLSAVCGLHGASAVAAGVLFDHKGVPLRASGARDVRLYVSGARRVFSYWYCPHRMPALLPFAPFS
jgi:hypothetical protein